MPKNKLATPDWILKGEKKPKKKTGKIFKIRKCPECGSFDVVVVTEKEVVGLWKCGKCGWEGKNIGWEELTEDEFMKYMDEFAPEGVPPNPTGMTPEDGSLIQDTKGIIGGKPVA